MVSSAAVVAIAINSEALTGQSSEWASLLANPFASPLASALCCQMEDAPTEALKGQSVEIAQIAFSRHGFKYLDGVDALSKT